MTEYDQIRGMCTESSHLSYEVIDDFLIYYAAKRDKLDREFQERIARFRHALREMPSNLGGLIESQYIGHRVFRKGGLLNKYMKHAAFRELLPEHRNFLQQIGQQPWRFCFSIILARPAPDFYEMEDLFTGEKFLLYSPVTTEILSSRPVGIWFNLIGSNGYCWQTFGPVIGFQSLDRDDIFFYATEFDETITSDEDITASLDKNPIPYMMLVKVSEYPRVRQGEFEVVHVTGSDAATITSFDTLKKDFVVEWTQQVFKITHPTWSAPPHFAEAYYDEDRRFLTIYALTDLGFYEMSKSLKLYDIAGPEEPDVRVHIPIVTLIENLLRRKVIINPYMEMFEKEGRPEDDIFIGKLNEFLSMALAYINSGTTPPIEKLARESGVDIETARDLLRHSMERIDHLRKQNGSA